MTICNIFLFLCILLDNILDYRLNPSHHYLNHFEDFHLSSSSKDSLPSIPSYRSSPKSNKNTITNSNKFDSFLSFDFSFVGLTSEKKSNKSQKNLQVLAPSEHSLKRNGKV